MPDGRLVFVESVGHRTYGAGGLAFVEPDNPFTTRRVLTPNVVMDGSNTAGRYTTPYPLPDGRLLVAYSPGRATSPLEDDLSEPPRFGLYTFDVKKGVLGDLIFDAPHVQDYDPVAVFPRPTPPVIPDHVKRNRQTGVFVCLNAYASDRGPSNVFEVGTLPPPMPGEIKAVRVLEGFGIKEPDYRRFRSLAPGIAQTTFGASSNSGNNFEQKRIVGEAPVYEDGSFSIEVPADTVLHLQTLDENGLALETQLTWVWVRPGEVNTCVGCHEDRTSPPLNLDTIARKKKPIPVVTPPEERRTVDFRRDLMPIIEAKCATADCHGPGAAGNGTTVPDYKPGAAGNGTTVPDYKPDYKPAGDLDLGGGNELVFHRRIGQITFNGAFFNRAYESLLALAPGTFVGKYVRPSAARYSPLMWRLYERQLAPDDARAPYRFPAQRTPHDKFLMLEERKLFAEWIDLGAQWDNLPGPDEFPGYDEGQSSRMLAQVIAKLSRPIEDPAEAFQLRCTECHDTGRIESARKTRAEWEATLNRMVRKQPDWFPQEELPRLLEHLARRFGEGRD
jgi:hypothetical protein